jgi:hypothetical protein
MIMPDKYLLLSPLPQRLHAYTNGSSTESYTTSKHSRRRRSTHLATHVLYKREASLLAGQKRPAPPVINDQFAKTNSVEDDQFCVTSLFKNTIIVRQFLSSFCQLAISPLIIIHYLKLRS